MGSTATHSLPQAGPREGCAQPSGAIRSWLTPSLCDLFFLAVIGWSFMTAGTGWSRLLWDGDTAIHLAIGNWILDHGRIPVTDPFSFTQPGTPWIPYEWGAAVVFAGLNHAFGLKGVVFVCGVIIAALITVLLRTMLSARADMLFSVLVALMVLLAWMLGPHSMNAVKGEAFECGNPPSGSARERFPVRFYLTAILFIVFDVEVVFLYPWAVLFRQLGWFGFAEMLVFVAVLAIALMYVWKKGALEWE